jgi:Arc/MetJ family transcription regulator
MKTTLNLPDDLINEAMHTLNMKTKSEVVIYALQDLLRRKKVASLKNYKGSVNLEIDLDVLRNRNANIG